MPSDCRSIASVHKRSYPGVRVTIWEDLLARNLKRRGVKFERQYRIGPFIVDFLVYPSLVVEAEGTAHSQTQQRDTMRTNYLESQGLTVFRIPNYMIREDSEGIADMLCNQQRHAALRYPTDIDTSTLLVMEGLHA
jgi:very-short-patch-repair endonuclease